MSQNVRMYSGVQAKYDALVEKNPLALYFMEDTQRLYKGDILIGVGTEASDIAAGLLSAEDYVELKKLIATGTATTLTPIDGTISIEDNQIGVQLSKMEGNIIVAQDDGLFASVESLPIESIVGLEERLDAIESASVGGIHYKGSVNTVEDLPTDATQGDLYEVLADNSEWCFNGTEWFEYGHTVDFSPIAGDGIEVDGHTVSVKIATESHGLVAVDGALSMVLATSEQDGAMSKEDKAFIDSIATVYATNEKLTEIEDTVAGLTELLTWQEM